MRPPAIIVACAADCRKGFYHDLLRQVSRAGMQFIYEEIKPFSWKRMIDWELDIANTFPSDIICFVDAWDFLLQGDAQGIVDALGTGSLLFHSESVCWPEPHKVDLYPPWTRHERFRYVNGTGPCGYGRDIKEAVRYGLSAFPIRGNESSIFADNDQRFWTDVYLSGRGAVDTDCKLSVSLNSVSRSEFEISDHKLRLDTGVTPVFVHANGASDTRYAAELEMLR